MGFVVEMGREAVITRAMCTSASLSVGCSCAGIACRKGAVRTTSFRRPITPGLSRVQRSPNTPAALRSALPAGAASATCCRWAVFSLPQALSGGLQVMPYFAAGEPADIVGQHHDHASATHGCEGLHSPLKPCPIDPAHGRGHALTPRFGYHELPVIISSRASCRQPTSRPPREDVSPSSLRAWPNRSTRYRRACKTVRIL